MKVVEIALRNVLMRHSALYLHNLGNDGLLRLLGNGICLALLKVGEGGDAGVVPVVHHAIHRGKMAVAEVSGQDDAIVPAQLHQIVSLHRRARHQQVGMSVHAFLVQDGLQHALKVRVPAIALGDVAQGANDVWDAHLSLFAGELGTLSCPCSEYQHYVGIRQARADVKLLLQCFDVWQIHLKHFLLLGNEQIDSHRFFSLIMFYNL